MCGIYFSCNRDKGRVPSSKLQENLKSRGPDSLRSLQFVVRASPQLHSEYFLSVLSSVLSLRGQADPCQPILSDVGDPPSLLCWNGEVWKWDNETLLCPDTDFIFEQLFSASASTTVQQKLCSNDKSVAIQLVLQTLSRISGPFAFVYYDSRHRLIFYGRDILGRRSLLQKVTAGVGIELASVCDQNDSSAWSEVKATGIYILDLDQPELCSASGVLATQHIPWQVSMDPMICYPLQSPFPKFNRSEHISAPLCLESPAVRDMLSLLKAAIDIRLNFLPKPCIDASSSRLAVLFSGGLDCTLLARLCHDALERNQPIDLLNVAFENPRIARMAAEALQDDRSPPSLYEACPDRITGRASHRELMGLCPGRRWNFITIDVPFPELNAHRSNIIALLKPHDTEMDFSIGCALYFAARGIGQSMSSFTDKPQPYDTQARVLLSGLGADELFGGYARHAAAFNRRGHHGLAQELELDFNRISERNLGRDDRIISTWAREVRYPFLDEEFVAWALSTPLSHKCAFGQCATSLPDLDPSKKLLRLGAWTLGLRGAAAQKKRAIQFGTRTAKMEIGKTKGAQKLLNLQ